MTTPTDYDDNDDGLAPAYHLAALTDQDVVDILAGDADNDEDGGTVETDNVDVAGYNTGKSREAAFRRMLFS
jgi:hypothetical protein